MRECAFPRRPLPGVEGRALKGDEVLLKCLTQACDLPRPNGINKDHWVPDSVFDRVRASTAGTTTWAHAHRGSDARFGTGSLRWVTDCARGLLNLRREEVLCDLVDDARPGEGH